MATLISPHGKQPVQVWHAGDSDRYLMTEVLKRQPNGDLPSEDTMLTPEDVVRLMAENNSSYPQLQPQHAASIEKGKTTDAPSLILVTTNGLERPKSGFIVPAVLPSATSCECIAITLNTTSSHDRSVCLSAGLVSTDYLKHYPVAISTKQTKRKNWLGQIWGMAQDLHPAGVSAQEHPQGFSPRRSINVSMLSMHQTLHLGIMFLWQYWNRTNAAVKSKADDLLRWKLHDPIDSKNLSVAIARMELKLCAPPRSSSRH